ncbi:MAG: glycoside hydrolase family 5 protein [Chitinophagaceae bacterium]
MKLKIIASVFFLLGILNAILAQPVKEHGQLQVTGTQLTDQKGKPLVLRGMSFGWSCFHPRFYTKGTVEWLYKDWGCNVLRAAMGIEPKNGYKQDSATNMQLISTVVDAAIAQGIYVIIDWHSHNINLTEANAFFKTMAAKYGKFPNLIYELFNEPDQETWPEVKAYAETLIKTIRAIDPDNIILVGSPHWDQYINLPAADPITGYKNLMYTMHFYAATHKQELRDRTSAAIKMGLPIFISESAGMDASGDKAIDDAEWQRWIDFAEANQLSWITWSVSDKDETCSVLQKSAASDGHWKSEDLKASGIKARNLYRKYNLGK